ncbi:MAG: M16 family metallopeptidase [Gammaproteobacteria bacterium]
MYRTPTPRILALATLCFLAFGWVTSHAAPPIQTWTTDNGVRVLFMETHHLPMVDARVIFRAGSARDGDKPGLAELTNAVLVEGSDGLPGTELFTRLEDVGAEFGNGSYRDMALLELRSLSDPARLEPAARTLALMLSKPDFPADALERDRASLLATVKRKQASAGAQAGLALYRELYGDHPYASPGEGNEASLTALTREDVKAFHRRYYVGRNATLAIVGDLDLEKARALAQTLVADLPAGQRAKPLPTPEPLGEGRVEHVAFPSSQSHLYLAQLGVARGDPDYFPLYVGNHILGGNGLVSNLSVEVREKRGLSYSVSSGFSPMATTGPFYIGLQTRNDQADEALAVALAEFRRFRDAGPSAEELSAAQRNITGSFPLNVDSNSDLIGYLGMIGFYEIPLDWLDRFAERVNAVSRDAVRDAFQRRMHPDALLEIRVGPKPADTAANPS